MTNLLRLSVLAAAATGAVALAGSVQAADPGFCRAYARAAVVQAREARSHPRCERAVRDNPARWQMDFRNHYEWCLHVSRREADVEHNARTETLERCTRGY